MFKEHQDRLESVFLALKKAQLTLKVKKCAFAQSQILCLGHQVTADGISPGPSKISAIVDFPSPKNSPPGIRLTYLRSILGVIFFNRQIVNHFASLVIPLYDLLKKECYFEMGERATTRLPNSKNGIIECSNSKTSHGGGIIWSSCGRQRSRSRSRANAFHHPPFAGYFYNYEKKMETNHSCLQLQTGYSRRREKTVNVYFNSFFWPNWQVSLTESSENIEVNSAKTISAVILP